MTSHEVTRDDTSRFRQKFVGVIGGDDNALVHAVCLREAGVHVQLGAAAGSHAAKYAHDYGVSVVGKEIACEESDVIVLCEPEIAARATYDDCVASQVVPGDTLVFTSGFNITYGFIEPPAGVDVVLVAPTSSPSALREAHRAGRGVPAFFAVQEGSSEGARGLALAYAKALGCLRAGVHETTFAQYTRAMLFGGRATVTGGVTALVSAAFEQLVAAGTDPVLAYAMTVEELYRHAAAMRDSPLGQMLMHHSDVELFAADSGGSHMVSAGTLARMNAVLAAISDGSLADRFVAATGRRGSHAGGQAAHIDTTAVDEARRRYLHAMQPGSA